MRIDIWSDLVCPFCYVGDRTLRTALTRIGIPAQIRWRSFELDPAAPRSIGRPLAELLAEKYRFDVDAATRFLEQQQRAADQAGLVFDWRIARRGNTFDAHRLIQLAKTVELADAVTERMFRGYFAEGAAIGDPADLRRLAVEAGLAGDTVDAVLSGDTFGADVREDERRAGELGIHAVPHFVVNGRAVLSGAVGIDRFVEVLSAESARTP